MLYVLKLIYFFNKCVFCFSYFGFLYLYICVSFPTVYIILTIMIICKKGKKDIRYGRLDWSCLLEIGFKF